MRKRVTLELSDTDAATIQAACATVAASVADAPTNRLFRIVSKIERARAAARKAAEPKSSRH